MRAKSFQLLTKRVIDLSSSFVIIVLGLPIWITISLLIKLTSKGPVLFIQERPGHKRKLFKVYKFRTMFLGSEVMIKGVEVSKNDIRVTAIGKLLRRMKVDEIPQLLNVFKGEMSLVGPRPERIASLKDYTNEIEKRLDMKPGLTGLAQVSGNIHLDLKERYAKDVYYVEYFSLFLDFRILIRTIFVVLLGEKMFKDRPLIKQ